MTECPICYEKMYFPKQIECGHIFHINCIYKWCNMEKDTCPCCRDPIKDVSLLLSKGKNITKNDLKIASNILNNRK